MAFKDRISSLFRRVGTGAAAQQAPQESQQAPNTAAREQPDEEERQELVRSLDSGVRQIGEALHHLDRHLVASSETIERAARGLSDLPSLAQQLGQAADSNRQLVDAMTEQLRHRDEAQAAVISSMQRLADGFEDQRRHDQQQVELVLRLHNTGRRMAVLLLGLAFVGLLVLICAILAIVLRPELVGLQRAQTSDRFLDAPSAAATARDEPQLQSLQALLDQEHERSLQALHTEIRNASQSHDPQVAARARQALAASER